jgi:hypothetical protein
MVLIEEFDGVGGGGGRDMVLVRWWWKKRKEERVRRREGRKKKEEARGKIVLSLVSGFIKGKMGTSHPKI